MNQPTSPNLDKKTASRSYIIKGLTLLFFAICMGCFIYIRASTAKTSNTATNTTANNAPINESGIAVIASDTGDVPKTDTAVKRKIMNPEDVFIHSSKSMPLRTPRLKSEKKKKQQAKKDLRKNNRGKKKTENKNNDEDLKYFAPSSKSGIID